MPVNRGVALRIARDAEADVDVVDAGAFVAKVSWWASNNLILNAKSLYSVFICIKNNALHSALLFK